MKMVDVFGGAVYEVEGKRGPKGEKGERGDRGVQGPTGPSGSMDYGYFGISALKHLPQTYRSEVVTLAGAKKKCSFIVEKENIDYYDELRITKWKDLESNGTLVQYLTFSGATYKLDNPRQKIAAC